MFKKPLYCFLIWNYCCAIILHTQESMAVMNSLQLWNRFALNFLRCFSPEDLSLKGSVIFIFLPRLQWSSITWLFGAQKIENKDDPKRTSRKSLVLIVLLKPVSFWTFNALQDMRLKVIRFLCGITKGTVSKTSHLSSVKPNKIGEF